MLFAQYPAVIAEMPDIFTSHDFILRLAQQNQSGYVEALYSYREDCNPFQVVHGVLSQRLHACDTLVEHLGNTPSRDIFGQQNGCGHWRKKPPQG